MTLLIACLVIAGLNMSPAWYIVAVIMWLIHIVFECGLSSASGQKAAKDALASLKGIRGVVKD